MFDSMKSLVEGIVNKPIEGYARAAAPQAWSQQGGGGTWTGRAAPQQPQGVGAWQGGAVQQGRVPQPGVGGQHGSGAGARQGVYMFLQE